MRCALTPPPPGAPPGTPPSHRAVSAVLGAAGYAQLQQWATGETVADTAVNKNDLLAAEPEPEVRPHPAT